MASLKQACALLPRASPHPFSFFVPSFKEASRGKPPGRQNEEIVDTIGNMKRKASLFSFLVIFYEYFVCLNLFLNFIGVQAFCHFSAKLLYKVGGERVVNVLNKNKKTNGAQ